MASMQFGNTLQHILQRLAYANPKFGPVHLLKFDLSDGYYRIRLSPEAALELAVIIPSEVQGRNYVGIPLSLPMGWNQSPPYFCAFTETMVDLANQALRQHEVPTPPHTIEQTSQSPSNPPPPTPDQNITSRIFRPGNLLQDPLRFIDVYMDDFIAMAQKPWLQRTLHHTVTSILRVFRDETLPQDSAA